MKKSDVEKNNAQVLMLAPPLFSVGLLLMMRIALTWPDTFGMQLLYLLAGVLSGYLAYLGLAGIALLKDPLDFSEE